MCVYKCAGCLCTCVYTRVSVRVCQRVSLAAADIGVILLVSWEHFTAPRLEGESRRPVSTPSPLPQVTEQTP